MNDDPEFLSALKSKDEKAWRIFIKKIRRPCYLLAKRYHCQMHFEDFFSETIVRLIEKDLQIEREDRTLEEVAARRFSDIISNYMHKAKRRKKYPFYEDDMTYPSASLLCEEEETYGLLEKAKNELSEEEKGLIEEYFYHDDTLAKMAGKRGVHASTVMRRLRKIYKKLEARLEGR